MECAKDRVKETKFEPSRSRILKAMKAITNGMHARDEARRTRELNAIPNSFTEIR
jgi:hypothetical protein